MGKSRERSQESRSKGTGTTWVGHVAPGYLSLQGPEAARRRISQVLERATEFRHTDPDRAFEMYMLRRPGTKKIGTHLQDWLTMMTEHADSGITADQARAQIRKWIDRNRAAIK